jgi:hypothetical protein
MTGGQVPEKQSRRLPAPAPSEDPEAAWDIRTSPINRTRNDYCTILNCCVTRLVDVDKNGQLSRVTAEVADGLGLQ